MEKKYQSPMVKVVEFKTEIGFAGSLSRQDDGNFEMTFDEDEGARNEQYQFIDGSTFWGNN